MKSSYYLLLVLMLLIAACTKPYVPNAITSVNNYLVVEGVIHTGENSSTLIKLSRTIPIDSAQSVKTEPGATVSIQSNSNQTYNLTETSPGVYTSALLNLNTTLQYRLNITTTDGRSYQSDYLTPKATPPIDSIGFTVQNNNMQVYVNTHDPNNNTHYYRWDYTETWQFNSEYVSEYRVNDSTQIVPRTASQYVYQCWSSQLSHNILLGSSANLTQDVIYQSPLSSIASTSEKIEKEYSILITQYALTADGYRYFLQLKQNTEQLGGIFDPQPTSLTGNLHCTTNASIPVIGYITAGTIQQKRVFIYKAQLPNSWNVIYPYDCKIDTALYNNPTTGFNDVSYLLLRGGSTEQPIDAIFAIGVLGPIGYTYSDSDCTDCSIRGTTIRPVFWQ